MGEVTFQTTTIQMIGGGVRDGGGDGGYQCE